MTQPKALILLATGTNRDRDVAQALKMVGVEPVTVPLRGLRQTGHDWKDYQILVVAGGFSYADALGAGKLLALDLIHYFSDQTSQFVAAGKPVIGICNGFQALVKSGILPFDHLNPILQDATLTFNHKGNFECRWVTLKPVSQKCLWTTGLDQLIDCPVAHGEGNFVVREPSVLKKLADSDQIALVYVKPDGKPANGQYPENPNGSIADIAGVCNPAGNVLGLMPHPEDNVLQYQSPHWMRQQSRSALLLFRNAIRYI